MALLALWIPAVSRAQAECSEIAALPTDPVLTELIEQSLSARPELAQAQALVQAERERVPQARALPNPMLRLGVQNDSFTTWNVGKMETSWYSIMLSQAIPLPGRRRLGAEVAGLGATLASQSLARARLSTEADVRRAYLGLMLARDRLRLLDRLEAISKRAALVAQARYETGIGTQADLLRAQLELKRIRQRRWTLEAGRLSALQSLNRLRDHPLDEPVEPPVCIADLALPATRAAGEEIQSARSRSPELASAQAGVSQGQSSLELARRSYVPELTVDLGVMPRGGDFPPMWLAQVGLPIPVFAGSGQSRAVAESESRLSASRSSLQALEQLLRLRVVQRRTALAATLETIRIYKDGLLAASEATAESTLIQYEVGRVSLLSVLEANAGLIADQEAFLQALALAQELQIGAAEVSLEPVGPLQPGMEAPSGPGGGAMGAGSPAPASGMPTGAPGVSGPAPGPGM
jgi:outer membrane protein TolC